MKNLVEKVKKKFSSSDSSKGEITRRSQLQEVPPVPPGLAVQAPIKPTPSPTKREIPIPENMQPDPQPTIEPETQQEPNKAKVKEEVSSSLQCPHCKKELKEDFEFCPYCGKSFNLTCSNCKKELAEEFDFCPYCGDEIKK